MELEAGSNRSRRKAADISPGQAQRRPG